MLAKKDETLIEIGKRLRGHDEDITREPLPRRWVELVLYLEEKERKYLEEKERKRGEPKTSGHPGAATE